MHRERTPYAVEATGDGRKSAIGCVAPANGVLGAFDLAARRAILRRLRDAAAPSRALLPH